MRRGRREMGSEEGKGSEEGRGGMGVRGKRDGWGVWRGRDGE